MFDAIRDLLGGNAFAVVEQFDLSGRPARYGPIPRYLFDSRIGLHLHRQFKAGPSGLWAHQAEAFEALGRGENIVVSTGTASGKSLIFRSHTFHATLLNPLSRTLVFYPLKALAADQTRGWKKMARELQLDENIIGRIDGSVPVKDREGILSTARIVVMTPDVCHAWLMYRLSSPPVREFVRSLSTVVMDEAHTLEGVFGSNYAFLIRRLIASRRHLRDDADHQPLQLVAATATIKNPGNHMKQLTGSDFTIIDHEQDGAPQYDRLVAHIESPEGKEIAVAKAFHDHLLKNGRNGGFITFLDSRKGVERLAMATDGSPRESEMDTLLDSADVLPYRAGYDAQDRQRIESRLQSGHLKGVVSTSALELGIDISHLSVGFNVGVPSTRKAYRQRLGRVGRNGPGAFLVIAPTQAFRGYGTSFREYHEMSVEPSYLYLDNRFMQFAHGRCLAVEQESLGTPSSTPAKVAWPSGFADMHAAARPGGTRPPEFDAVAALGGDTPHHGYPLRNVGELNFKIKLHANSDSFGDVSQLQALRECYPGGTYLHLAKPYEVAAWYTSAFDSFIQVKRAAPGRQTRPRITTWVNTGITSTEIQESHLVTGEAGFLAECLMQITQRVEGYVDERTGKFHSYKDLQQHNPNMRARSRNFRTTGVVLCINREWFKNGSLKMAFANRLREVFVREYSVAPQDVGQAASNISVQKLDGGGVHGGCVAVFDEIYGSLRLTERLYTGFEHLLDRLLVAVEADSTEREQADFDLESVVSQVKEEVSAFTGGTIQEAIANAPKGYEQVFTRGSRVCYRQAGVMAVDVEIIQPTMMDGELMYQIRLQLHHSDTSARRWVSASAIEPSADADAWEYALWNRETETYEEPEPPEDDGT